MTTLEDILAGVLRELGPDASDEDLKAKLLDTVEALPDEQRREVLGEMATLASRSHLAHLLDVGDVANDQDAGPTA